MYPTEWSQAILHKVLGSAAEAHAPIYWRSESDAGTSRSQFAQLRGAFVGCRGWSRVTRASTHPIAETPVSERFYPAVIRHGELFDVQAETLVIFDLESGRATGFEMRTNNEVVGRAERAR